MTTSCQFRSHKLGPVYALAELTIHDRMRYQQYVRRFHDVLQRFGGRILAADESPEVVEGSWKYDKIVLLEFASTDSFWAWARSEEYREISRDRVASTEGTVLLVHGMG
jgi:uncharacterized protein (DUF1330 family)